MIHQRRNFYSYRKPEGKGYRSEDGGDLMAILLLGKQTPVAMNNIVPSPAPRRPSWSLSARLTIPYQAAYEASGVSSVRLGCLSASKTACSCG
jgi:hypothetical protein